MQHYAIPISEEDINTVEPSDILNYTDMIIGGNMPPKPGDIAIISGGFNGIASMNTIQLTTVSTGVNAVNTGVLNTPWQGLVSRSNGTKDKALHSINGLQLSIISTGEDSTITGNMSTNVEYHGAADNSTSDIHIIVGGSVPTDIIQRSVISTCTNSIQSGSMPIASGYNASTSNGINDIGYHWQGTYKSISIVSTGASAVTTRSGDSNITRGDCTSNGINDVGLIIGGHDGVNYRSEIYRVTISTGVTVTPAGTLIIELRDMSATSNGIADMAIINGGRNNSYVDDIRQKLVSTLDDAIAIGHLTVPLTETGSTCNS